MPYLTAATRAVNMPNDGATRNWNAAPHRKNATQRGQAHLIYWRINIKLYVPDLFCPHKSLPRFITGEFIFV